MPKYTGHVTMTYKGSIGQSSRHYQENEKNDFESFERWPILCWPNTVCTSGAHALGARR